jgi:hypothetical protein
MSETLVIVFGSQLLADNWARQNAVNPRRVRLATHPEKFLNHDGPFKVIRFSENIWKPTTFPDEKRLKVTEAILKRASGRFGGLSGTD